MSILKRFGKRDNASLTVEFDWPVETKDFRFKAARFSQAEQNEAHLDADGQLARRGIKRDDENKKEHYLQAFWYELAKYVKKHIKGWEYKGPEKIDYSAGALEELFNSLTIAERTEIGMAYWLAEQELLAEKKSDSVENAV